MRKNKFIIVALLVFLVNSMTCFAAEKEEMTVGYPSQINVEGGQLILLDEYSDELSQAGSARYQYHVITDGSNLNVRSGPGLNYSIIGKFKNGQIIDVSYMQEAGIYPWVYAGGIDANTGNYIYGYIHSDYYG